mmetsp:Transcript_30231/g.96558  ORF Transcript_30231/g.96558 Transcript_30231/m.96558 type:complete len:202 (-) Transcript_30231:798-1403(-)
MEQSWRSTTTPVVFRQAAKAWQAIGARRSTHRLRRQAEAKVKSPNQAADAAKPAHCCHPEQEAKPLPLVAIQVHRAKRPPQWAQSLRVWAPPVLALPRGCHWCRGHPDYLRPEPGHASRVARLGHLGTRWGAVLVCFRAHLWRCLLQPVWTASAARQLHHSLAQPLQLPQAPWAPALDLHLKASGWEDQRMPLPAPRLHPP